MLQVIIGSIEYPLGSSCCQVMTLKDFYTLLIKIVIHD